MTNEVQIILPGAFIDSILQGIDAEPSQAALINSLVAKLQLINNCMKNVPEVKRAINENVTQLSNATFN